MEQRRKNREGGGKHLELKSNEVIRDVVESKEYVVLKIFGESEICSHKSLIRCYYLAL